MDSNIDADKQKVMFLNKLVFSDLDEISKSVTGNALEVTINAGDFFNDR